MTIDHQPMRLPKASKSRDFLPLVVPYALSFLSPVASHDKGRTSFIGAGTFSRVSHVDGGASFCARKPVGQSALGQENPYGSVNMELHPTVGRCMMMSVAVRIWRSEEGHRY